MDSAPLDQLDLRLLDALQRNARATYADLGEMVGLSAPSAHERVKRLEQRGFIRRYGAQLNNDRLGLGLTAFVSCFISAETSYESFTQEASKLPEVCEIHSVTGEETFILKVVTRSTRHLDEFLTRLKQINGVERTKTTIVLSTTFEREGIVLAQEQKAPARRLRSVR